MCADCMAGPSGVAGHDRLFSQTMSADEMHFRCRACSVSWARRLALDGSHVWAAIDAPYGADVPGRPGTAPP